MGWHARLVRRRVLEIKGPDATKLLNGLVTNLIPTTATQQQPPLPTHAAFLNAAGRILATAFLVPSEDPHRMLLDADKSVFEPLLKHIQRRKLRSNVTLTDLSDTLTVVASCGGDGGGGSASGGGPSVGGPAEGASWADPRLQSLGWRAITDTPESHVLAQSQEVSPRLYDMCAAALGVGDDALGLPPGDALPLESNLELMGSVSFDKGCYLGQELTARTHFRGVTRKRLMPAVLPSDDPLGTSTLTETHPELAPLLEHLPTPERSMLRHLPPNVAQLLEQPESPTRPGQALSTVNGEPAGKIRYIDDTTGLGLALVRLHYLDVAPRDVGGPLLTPLLIEGGPEQLVVHRPSWWPSDL